MERTTPDFRPHDAMLLWLDHCAVEGKSDYTIRNYQSAIESFLQTCSAMSIADVSSNHLIAHLARIRGTGVQPATVAWHQRHLNAWLGWLYERGDIPRDPRRGVGRVKVPTRHQRAVTPEIRAKLLRVLRDRPPLRTGALSLPQHYFRNIALVEVLWATWARREELAQAQWEDVDWRRRVLLLRHTKTGQERTVPLSAEAVQALREYHIREAGRADVGPMFGMSGNAIRLVLQRAAERAGVKVSAHDFRRGGVANARAKGIDIAHAMQIMGHTTPTMTIHYSRTGEEDAAIEAYRRLLG